MNPTRASGVAFGIAGSEHLPFFGVQTDKVSMQKASPTAKAIMWSAGVTSSAIVPTLSTITAWRIGMPGSTLFLIFAVFCAFLRAIGNGPGRLPRDEAEQSVE